MRIFAIITSILLFITLDLISKWFFSGVFQGFVFGCNNTLSSIGCDILQDKNALFSYFPIFGEVFGIQLAHNTGVAFSFPIPPILLQILTITLIAIIIFYFSKTEFPKQSKLLDFGYTCILAGALSHAYERIVYGYVVDFFSLKYFAIFNFADILISIGAISILFYYFYYERNHTTK